MPSVLRIDGFDVIVFLPDREHGPAHVHVRKAGKEVVVTLEPVAIVRTQMTRAETGGAVRLVEAHREFLLSEWRKYHG